MRECEILFFKRLEEQSKDNPMVRIQAASDYITDILKQAFTNNKGTRGDMWCYMLATMTGALIATTAKETEQELETANVGNSAYMPLTKVASKREIFWIGDAINKYLYNTALSVWNIVMTLYSQKHVKQNLPKLEEIIRDNAKKMGDPSVRIWNNEHNPYSEISSARKTYYNLVKKLQPYKLQIDEYPSVFAFSLANVIINVEHVFPNKLNCLEMSMETVAFYAHVDF